MNPLKQPRMVIGFAFVALGIFFILMNIGMIEHIPLARFWPLILILIGISRLIQDNRGRGLWSGLWLLLLGVWFQLVTLNAFGLTYRNSWPLILIVWGLYLTGEALARNSSMKLTKENRNGN